MRAMTRIKMLRRTCLCAFLALAAVVSGSDPAPAAGRSVGRNLVNTPFRTVTREPLSAFRVQIGDSGRPEAALSRALNRLRVAARAS